MNAAAKLRPDNIASILTKADAASSAFKVTGPRDIVIKAGTIVAFAGETRSFVEDTPVNFIFAPNPGTDFRVVIDLDGKPNAYDMTGATKLIAALEDRSIGGFHFAPGSNATARAGGDDVSQINPFSCWDLNFRPACADPRGMTLIDDPQLGRFWVDIYLLNDNPFIEGGSRFACTIADGDSCPRKLDGSRYEAFDFKAATEVFVTLGKTLLTYDEFRVAAFGGTEKTAAPCDPKITGLDAARTSQRGLVQAFGNLWVWGTDGDPDTPRASIFGGSWIYGGNAGSRYAFLGYWAEVSVVDISARGRSDHLQLV